MIVRMRFKTKVIAVTFCIVALSLLAGGFFTYDYATGIIREQSIPYHSFVTNSTTS